MAAAPAVSVPDVPPPSSGLAPTTALALGAAVVSGALVALQQRLNGQLAVDLSDALLAAVVSFGTGLLVVTAAVVGTPSARQALGAVRRVPWWTRLGGLGGATLVAVGATATPRIGVALLTVGLVAGQTGGGLLVDRLGLAPGGAHRLTAPRLAGAALSVLAVAAAAAGQDARAAAPLLLVVVVVAGLLIAVQQALNGQVRLTTGNATVATLVNFVVGGAALVGGWLLAVSVRGLAAGHWPGPGQWYLYLGGPIGAAFVGTAAVVVRQLGVLRLGLAVIAGQLIGAVALDLVLPATGRPISAATLVGVALTLAAVGVSGRTPRRSTPPTGAT